MDPNRLKTKELHITFLKIPPKIHPGRWQGNQWRILQRQQGENCLRKVAKGIDSTTGEKGFSVSRGDEPPAVSRKFRKRQSGDLILKSV